MPLSPGTRLGPYEILAPIGAGGMGEVFRARDTRLDRTVAIKILTQGVADTPEVRARFDREARAVSSFNHPHICALYDVGHQDGTDYLVMEYLDGETLAGRIEKGPLPTGDLLRYSSQIADALDKAHRRGIVHRDLKPGNVMLTKSGAKLLDFGLAKGGDVLQGDIHSSPTMSQPLTARGTILGTMQYMSPEQLEGKEADARSDIFSFGAMLYEMATGKKAFDSKSHASLIAAILKEDPRPMRDLQPTTPLLLERIVKTCLAKDPDDRPQSAHDLKLDLDWVRESSGISDVAIAAPAPQASHRSKAPAIFLAAGILALLATAAIAFFYWPRTPAAERLEFPIILEEESSHLAISADGRMLAVVSPDKASGANMLSIERVGSTDIIVLPGTAGVSYPFWSPDDSYLGFFADGKLKKIAASGGTPQVLANATTGRGGSWGRRGVIIYAPEPAGFLWKVNADGSGAAPFTDKLFDPRNTNTQRWPFFLPDGDHFLFWSGTFANSSDDHTSGIYVSSLAAKDMKLVLQAHTNAAYSKGYIFYVDDKGSLRATSMDASTGTTSGELHTIADQIGFQPSTNWGAFTVAENGTVVYNPTVGASLSVLTWYDAAGKELGHVGDIGVLSNPTISPDGSRLTVDIADAKANSVNIWLADLNRGTSSRFTFDPTEDVAGIWSRDGGMIAYRSIEGLTQIMLKQSQGLQPAKSIYGFLQTNPDANDDLLPNSWSLDDKQVLCTIQPHSGGSHLVLASVADGKILPFLSTKASQSNGLISPDGKWVAYESNESGNWEIYVTTFPKAAGKWQVSRGGGTEPRWRADEKEIFYIGAMSTLTAVPVNAEGSFSSGNPVPLFRAQLRAQVSSTDIFTYDVTKDGKRFIINRYAKPAQVPPLHIIFNATAGFAK